MKYSCSVICDIGIVRKNNEDNFYINGIYRENVSERHIEYSCEIVNNSIVAGVFDGMGGEADGELASLEAAKRLVAYQNKDFSSISSDYVVETNDAICQMMDTLGKGRMGSTMAIVEILGNVFSLCNIGDSPVYLFREGCLEQLSTDHNEAQNLYEMGLISKDEVKTNKHKNCLTQHLGIYEDEVIIEPFVSANNELKVGDIIMICSDGLTDMVSDVVISRILEQNESVSELAQDLMTTALENGGRDNVTVMLVKVQE